MKAIAMVLACALALMLSACTTTLPLVGQFSDYNEVFVGTVNNDLMTGNATIQAKAKNSGVACFGNSVVTHIPASNYIAGAFMIPYCTGQTGIAELKCDDGRRVSATWTADSCSSGYGEGSDQSDAKFQFTFGMSEQEAVQKFKTASEQVASKPDLPVYRPGETRKRIGFATGTGFLVTSDGYLITNYHVVDGAKEIIIHQASGDVPARVVKTDRQDDVALLKADIHGLPIQLQTSPHPKVAEQVMALGYPLVTLEGQALKATFGHVNALTGIKDDPRFMQIDVPIQPGNSGGPLINEKGELLGITTETLDQLVTLREAGVLPQNVNYAVKSNYVLSLVDGLQNLGTKPPSSGFESLVTDYGNSVFLVIVK